MNESIDLFIFWEGYGRPGKSCMIRDVEHVIVAKQFQQKSKVAHHKPVKVNEEEQKTMRETKP